MPDNSKDEENKELIIPIYLDEQLIMDMIATIDDGFSELCTIETSSSKKNGNGLDGSMSGSVLKLFQAKTSLSHMDERGEGTKESKSKVQTPASMFNNVKMYLQKHKMIKDLTDDFVPGDFVELEGEFSLNPLIDLLETFSSIFESFQVFEDKPKKQNSQKEKESILSQKRMEAQIKGLIKIFETEGKIDVLCKTENRTLIIPAKKEFFKDQKGDIVRVGKFKLLGKVIKICDRNESISLLRDTKLGRMKSEVLATAVKSFNSPEMEEFFDLKPVEIDYNSSILVYPISIYL